MTRRQNALKHVVGVVGPKDAKGSALWSETSSPNHNSIVLTPPSDTSTSPPSMTDAFSALTTGALRNICDGQQVDNPIVQCVQIKPMAANQQTGQERWRVVFNDSVNFIQGMIAIQSNYLITDGTLKKGSVCRLTQYQANFVKDKHILIIVALDVLTEYGEPDKLGQPVAIEGAKPEAQQDVKPQPGNIAGNGFYGNKPQAQQQQQQQSLSARPKGTLTHGGHANITPIEAVSPYTHKWTIKARCTHKGDIKTWHNKNGEGKLFSANFLDDSGEIRATGFNDSVDQWYEFLEEGNVYYISSPCKVQLAKKQFSTVNNDYELTFERDTVVEKAEDHEGVPQVRYNFTSIEALQNIEKDSTIDCIGVLQDVGEVSEIVSKTTNKPYSKRELTLVDDSGYNVRLTVWGKTAESFEARAESVVAFKGVKVSDFGGRSLSLLASGSMNVDPDIEEAYKLKGWYEGAGRSENFASHANSMATAGAASGGRNDFKTISAVYDEKIGQTETTEWFSVKATIVYVKQDSFAYPACRTMDPQPCNKKVLEADEGNWRCEKCDKTWDAPKYRYIMSVNVSDHTGQIWLSCFDEVGAAIMGMPANELMAMKEEGDDKRVGEVFSDANCKTFNFKCRAKMDNFQDQQRVRYQVQYANPLDFSRETKKLTDILKQYNLQENSMFV